MHMNGSLVLSEMMKQLFRLMEVFKNEKHKNLS